MQSGIVLRFDFSALILSSSLLNDISDVEKSRETLIKEVIATVRENVGPVASFKDVIIVPRLPKTRSGKIARNTLAAIAAGQPYRVRAYV